MISSIDKFSSEMKMELDCNIFLNYSNQFYKMKLLYFNHYQGLRWKDHLDFRLCLWVFSWQNYQCHLIYNIRTEIMCLKILPRRIQTSLVLIGFYIIGYICISTHILTLIFFQQVLLSLYSETGYMYLSLLFWNSY